MIPVDLDALQALADAATPRPWVYEADEYGEVTLWGPDDPDKMPWRGPVYFCAESGDQRLTLYAADAALIVALRNNAEALIARCREAEAARDTLAEAYDVACEELETARALVDDVGDCPYLDRYESIEGHDPEATCAYGCVDEPACVTDQPRGGWPSRWGPRSLAAEARVGALTDLLREVIHQVSDAPNVDLLLEKQWDRIDAAFAGDVPDENGET